MGYKEKKTFPLTFMNRMYETGVLLLIGVLLLPACWSTEPIRMRGVVQEVDREVPEEGLQPGKRLSGAEIELHCPGRAPNVLGETDAYGRFKHRGAREIPVDCRLTARRDGFQPRSYEIAEVCASLSWRDNQLCEYLGFTVRLVGITEGL